MSNEKRLIDVSDEHIKEILSQVPYYPDEIWKFGAMTKRFSAVDAVEVVRCKDCKFYEAGVEYYGGGTKDICRLFKRQMQNDDFCSYGERGTANY